MWVQVEEMLIQDLDLGVLSSIWYNCIEAGDSHLLSDYFGEESEFDTEDWRDRNTVRSVGGIGYIGIREMWATWAT
jgi:hypothetical protein